MHSTLGLAGFDANRRTRYAGQKLIPKDLQSAFYKQPWTLLQQLEDSDRISRILFSRSIFSMTPPTSHACHTSLPRSELANLSESIIMLRAMMNRSA